MNTSFFMDKNKMPSEKDLAKALGNTVSLWQEIHDYVHKKYPAAMDEWKVPMAKFGWSFRVKDKKRVIVYLGPRDTFFIVSFVFGQKAYDMILESTVSEGVKSDLKAAKVYVEGRGVSIKVKDKKPLKDIFKLIDIKLETSR
ncbi:MAG: DUF3788 family protein [Chitinophagaceae bacterium]|nr:DUF3788 family protein [Chitinophagaceae bacterium]